MPAPHEFVVFLPLGDTSPNDTPLETVRALALHLGVGRAEIGQDVLTGGVEARFYYDANLLARAKAWLREQAATFDISIL